MDKLTWLACAFTLVCFGLGAYLAALGLRLRRLERQIRRLEQAGD